MMAPSNNTHVHLHANNVPNINPPIKPPHSNAMRDVPHQNANSATDALTNRGRHITINTMHAMLTILI